MIFSRHAVAILAVGFTELPAWGQAPVAATGSCAPGSAHSGAAATTTAVAAFPDVQAGRPPPPRDESLDLLATDPYAAELSFLQARRNLFGDGLDDDDPYAEALRLVNPYARSTAAAGTEDLSSPYSTTGSGGSSPR